MDFRQVSHQCGVLLMIKILSLLCVWKVAFRTSRENSGIPYTRSLKVLWRMTKKRVNPMNLTNAFRKGVKVSEP